MEEDLQSRCETGTPTAVPLPALSARAEQLVT